MSTWMLLLHRGPCGCQHGSSIRLHSRLVAQALLIRICRAACGVFAAKSSACVEPQRAAERKCLVCSFQGESTLNPQAFLTVSCFTGMSMWTSAREASLIHVVPTWQCGLPFPKNFRNANGHFLQFHVIPACPCGCFFCPEGHGGAMDLADLSARRAPVQKCNEGS